MYLINGFTKYRKIYERNRAQLQNQLDFTLSLIFTFNSNSEGNQHEFSAFNYKNITLSSFGDLTQAKLFLLQN